MTSRRANDTTSAEDDQIELATDHRSDREHLVRVHRQTRQAPAERIAYALGNPDVRRGHGVHPVAVNVLRHRPALGEVGKDLLGEVRVPLRLLVDEIHELRRCGVAGRGQR